MTSWDNLTPTDDDALAAYLGEHWAAMRAGVAVVQRLARDDALQAVAELDQLAADCDADYLTFDQILAELDLTEPGSGPPAGLLSHLVTDPASSPLSAGNVGSVLAWLSALGASVEAKRALWTTLLSLAPQDRRLSEPQLRALTERALEQLLVVERLRRLAVTRGLGPPP